MRTTSVIAELLVGGVLTVVWLTQFAMVAIGIEPVIEAIQSGSLYFGIIILTVAYALGVVFDQLWKRWLKSRTSGIKKSIVVPDRPAGELFRGIYKNEGAMNYVNQVQNRMRVARASLCNTALITIASITLVAVRGSGLLSFASALCILSGAVVLVVTRNAFDSLTRSYYQALMDSQPIKHEVDDVQESHG